MCWNGLQSPSHVLKQGGGAKICESGCKAAAWQEVGLSNGSRLCSLCRGKGLEAINGGFVLLDGGKLVAVFD